MSIKHTMLLMETKDTGNGFKIKDDMILNSLDSFIDKPIVLNKNAEWKDYTKEQANREYFEDKVVGIIKSVEFALGEVTGEVLFTNEEYIRDKYDNWQITFNEDDRSKFILDTIEIFE